MRQRFHFGYFYDEAIRLLYLPVEKAITNQPYESDIRGKLCQTAVVEVSFQKQRSKFGM